MKRVTLLIAAVLNVIDGGGVVENVCDGLNVRMPCDCHVPDHVICRDRSVSYLDEIIWPDDVDVVEINLSRNGLVSILRETSFWPASLKRLDLSRNHIEDVEDAAFSSAPSLEQLVLARNFLEDLPPGAFEGLAKLQTLDLSSNKLGRIRREWFEETPGLVRLDLSDNPIGDEHESIYDGVFAPLPRLRYLDLSGCGLSFLPLDVFESNLELREVRLARNPLAFVPLTQLYPARVTLEFLDLAQTDVDVIPNRAFHGLRSLQTLILDNLINLSKVEALAFHDLTALQNLQLQGCTNLTYIDPFAFCNYFEDATPNPVANVNLANNALSFISESLLQWEKVETIRLDGNPWRCDCDLSWMAVTTASANLTLSELTVCHSPNNLYAIPIGQLVKENFDCTTSRSWIVFGLFLSILFVIVSFFVYLCYQYASREKSRKRVWPQMQESRRQGDRPPPADYNGWSRIQGLFHKDKLRSGYYRVMRSERGNNFQELRNENESQAERELSDLGRKKAESAAVRQRNHPQEEGGEEEEGGMEGTQQQSQESSLQGGKANK